MTTIKQVLSENPDITKSLSEFFKQKLLSSTENNKKIPHTFKQLLTNTGVSEEMILTYLQATPRLICDFMDDKKVIILPIYDDDNGKFSFSINGNAHSKLFTTRKEAEIESVVVSINFYKKVLNNIDEKK